MYCVTDIPSLWETIDWWLVFVELLRCVQEMSLISIDFRGVIFLLFRKFLDVFFHVYHLF